MTEAHARIATDIATELAPLLNTFLVETDLHNKQNLGIQIRRVLWENKVGILRMCESLSHQQLLNRSQL